MLKVTELDQTVKSRIVTLWVLGVSASKCRTDRGGENWRFPYPLRLVLRSTQIPV